MSASSRGKTRWCNEASPLLRRARTAERTILSYALALGIYGLLFGAAFLFDLLTPQNLDFSNKTLIVNIQGPVANDVGKGSPVEKKAPELVAEKPAPPPQPAPKPQTQTATKSAPTVPAPTSVAQPAPSARLHQRRKRWRLPRYPLFLRRRRPSLRGNPANGGRDPA